MPKYTNVKSTTLRRARFPSGERRFPDKNGRPSENLRPPAHSALCRFPLQSKRFSIIRTRLHGLKAV
ncbi:hypothetical protein HMPREF9123_1316 [Neisseria bacilliformis ATCC BAA-1200]|uniref:Uncharacterized protein n=1 Tax=Neisseria bacilliformis ATCC BAA-1200 TaxID=888742 RepID=F2BC61_9NEIS|nr:hypothetical protein HMPREF9123_1316 [Neisseria bacilliformis ATCC BAA-1200]